MGQTMNAMAFPGMNSMNGFQGMPMNAGIYNPGLVGNNMFMNQDVNWNMWGQAYSQQHVGLAGTAYQNGMYTAGYSAQNGHMPMSDGYSGTNGVGTKGHHLGSFPNQQRSHFQGSNDEDSAYFRKPVNPHRHQARRNMNRPTDYREI